MLTDIQQRKMMYAYRVVYQGMKSRIIIRELIPIIGFFQWEGTVDPFHIQFIRNYNCKQPKWNDKEECLVKQVRAELGQAQP